MLKLLSPLDIITPMTYGLLPPPEIVPNALPVTSFLSFKLSDACVPAMGTAGFTLSGTAAKVLSWQVTGQTLTLTLDRQLTRSDKPTLTYNPNLGVVQALTGEHMPSFSNMVVPKGARFNTGWQV